MASAERPVLVHCHHGEGRSVWMCAIHRIQNEGWSNEAAFDGTSRLPDCLRFVTAWFPGLRRFDAAQPKGRMVLDDQLDTIRERHDPRTLLVRTGADPAEFKRHAEAIDGIRSIRPGEGPDVLELSLDEHFDLGDGIPSRLVTELNAVGPMRTIEIRTPSLDDVFVKLVGSSVERMEEEAMP